MPPFLTLHLRRLAVLACFVGLMPQAWAADIADGQAIFGSVCATCHGSSLADSHYHRAANNFAYLDAAIRGVMSGFSNVSSLTDAQRKDVAAFIGNSPASLNFSSTAVGQQSGAQSLTVRASDLLALSSILESVTGDFRRSGGSCGTTLAAGSTCTIDVQFAPTAAGTRTGAIHVANNGIPGEDIVIALSGTAAAAAAPPVLATNATAVSFPDQLVSTTSAVKKVIASNIGGQSLNFTSIALAGAAAADYTLLNGTSLGACAVGTPLVSVAVDAHCGIDIAFKPSATGTRTATLNLTSDGGNAAIALSGNGILQVAPVVSFSAPQLTFGNQTVGTTSAAQNVTVTNTGTAALNITGLQAGAPFNVSDNNCGASLAAQANCTVQITFAPTGTGSVTGTLTLTSNATGSPHKLSLSGAGVSAAPQLAWTPAATSLDFGSGPVGAATASKALTLTNQGPGGAVVSELRLGGAQAHDFSIDGASTCHTGETIAAGSSCNVVIAFVPGAAGARSATLDVISNGNAPGSIALTGIGIAAPAPTLSLSSTSLVFARPTVAGGSASQQLTLSNGLGANTRPSADLQITALTLSNPSFTVTGAGSSPCSVPFTLVPGAQCSLVVTWNGSGDVPQATLSITTNASATPQAVALSGQTTSASNSGGGGCTMGEGTGSRDPALVLMVLAAAALLWRRARRKGAVEML